MDGVQQQMHSLEQLVGDVARGRAVVEGEEHRAGQLELVVWALTFPYASTPSSSSSVSAKQMNMVRKQALYVLEMLFRNEYGAGWVSTFLQLYMGLDDTSLHLFSSCFGQMAYAMGHPGIPVRLKSLLWRMALLHRQPTAQKESVVAFLSLAWDVDDDGIKDAVDDTVEQAVEEAVEEGCHVGRRSLIKFMLEEDGFLETGLIPVLSQDRIYRGMHGSEIDGLVDVFYGRIVGAGVDVGRVVGRLLGLMGGTPRPGVLVACARAVDRLCVCANTIGGDWVYGRGDGRGDGREELGVLRRQMVGAAKALRRVCFGSNYGAVQCHRAIMLVGAVVFRDGVCEEMLGYLSEVPRALVVEGGLLHEVAKAAVAVGEGVDAKEDGARLVGYLRAYPAAAWLVMYLREGEDVLDAVTGLGDWKDVFGEAGVLLPCLQLVSTASVCESVLGRGMWNRGLLDVFSSTACSFASHALLGARDVDRLIDEVKFNLESGTRGALGDSLEPFFDERTINARERLAMQWECVVLICRLVGDGRLGGSVEMRCDLEAAVMDSLVRVEQAIDELLVFSLSEGSREKIWWHALVEAILIDTRILAHVGEALKALGAIVPSKANQYKTSVSALMDRGPDSLDKSLRGWFELSAWKAINGFAIPVEDGVASNVAALAVDTLLRAKDGCRAVIPVIHCMRTLMPTLVAAGNTDDVASMGKALVTIAKSHTRRRLGITAAVITTVIHPCLFDEGTPPPMRDLVHGFCLELIDAGRRYARLFVSLSCHLAVMLRDAPGEQRLQYVDVLQELLMSGFDNEEQVLDLRNEVLDDPTREELEFVLSAVPRNVSLAYRMSECAPRIACLCLLHEWVNEGVVDGMDGNVAARDGTGKEVCRRLWNRLYSLSRTDKELSKGTYMHGGPVHKRKLRLWQAIATLCPVIPDDEVDATMGSIMEDLTSHNHASVKYYQELIGLSLVLRDPSLLETRVFPSLSDYSSQRRDDLQSLFCIVAVALDNLKEERDPRYDALVDASIEHILPWTGAFPHAARSFGQVILFDILQRARDRTDRDRNLKRLREFFLSNKDMKKMLLAMGITDGLVPQVRLASALHPTGLVKSEGYTLISRDFQPRTSKYKNVENTPMSLVERMVEFLHERRAETRSIRDDMLSQVRDRDVLGVNFEEKQKRQGPEDDCTQGAEQFWQRKITYDWTGALGLDILGDAGSTATDIKIDDLERALANADIAHGTTNGSHSNTASTGKAHQPTSTDTRSIIVVASFIDKVPNLAGLCRTCEIFQAKALVVSDASVTEHPDFATISVSANTWTPIEEVNRDDVGEWLQTMKMDGGWSLVGLEQTDESVSLPSFSWPDKTILVLGAEKEGVPMDILRLLDATVEIPQLGVIRSLNVHVSAALAIYSFRAT